MFKILVMVILSLYFFDWQVNIISIYNIDDIMYHLPLRKNQNAICL